MAFRTTSFACPACHEEISAAAAITWCKACKGAWVSEAELEERVRIVRGKNELDLALVFEPGRPAAAQARRACPLCREPLGHASLGMAEVDRCGQKHGIWFDAGELETVLTAATEGVGVKVQGVKLSSDQDVRGTSNESMSVWNLDDTGDVIEYIAVFIVSLFD